MYLFECWSASPLVANTSYKVYQGEEWVGGGGATKETANTSKLVINELLLLLSDVSASRVAQGPLQSFITTRSTTEYLRFEQTYNEEKHKSFGRTLQKDLWNRVKSGDHRVKRRKSVLTK